MFLYFPFKYLTFKNKEFSDICFGPLNAPYAVSSEGDRSDGLVAY
jgi:hypothetical protein